MVFAGLSLIFGLSILAKKGGMDEMDLSENDTFAVAPDGIVMVDGLSFPSLSEYYMSEYFKANGKRCKNVHSGSDHLVHGGLAHTLATPSDCSNSFTCGDLILDTNAESGPFYDCGPRTTCGNADPTTNYMDYSEDLCMYEFTPQQDNRMTCSIVNYRPNL